jgi:hypothetical protein
MKHRYLGLWTLLVVAFAAFAVSSAFDGLKIGNFKLKSSCIVESLTQGHSEQSEPQTDLDLAIDSAITAETVPEPIPCDTTVKTILLFGDSMLEGLSPRLAAYCEKNGYKLYTVIWYSSTSVSWGSTERLAGYIRRVKPDYIFACLGANELFVTNIANKRRKYVQKIVKTIGDIPFVWIGPPNWKNDTGINELIAETAPKGCYFKTKGMSFERKRDGAHPTAESAYKWVDSVARWMPLNSAHPIKLDLPDKKIARPKRMYIHQPNE